MPENHFFCEPARHRDKKVPAEWVLSISQRHAFGSLPSMFAACAKHVDYGYDRLQPKAGETVTIRRVSK